MPFALRRYQFPVRLAWAMTINKSQGQTSGERIGVYLPEPVFAHGQMYCDVSRATRSEHVRILAKEYEQDQKFVVDETSNRCLQTLNVVNRAFLHGTRRPTASPTRKPHEKGSHCKQSEARLNKDTQIGNGTLETLACPK